MTITGKKFSQLTDAQKIATRVPIAGWIVNNLFINPLGKYISFESIQTGDLDIGGDGRICLANSAATDVTIPPDTAMPIGGIVYTVNWNTDQFSFIAGVGVTLSPGSSVACKGSFGVFKLEKTGVNEWTVSVVENGTLEGGLG